MVKKHVPLAKIDETTNVLWDLRKHSIWLAQQFEQLKPDFDDTLETWLSKTSYTAAEKQGFRDVLLESECITCKDRYCKCFVKAETYPSYKFPRPIKSRTDRFKAKMGPIFQGINECLFSNTKWFIKKQPVDIRPAVLKERLLPATQISLTDFSQFEAHFIDCIMYAIEFPFYCWVTRLLPQHSTFMEELEITLLSSNKCIFKDFVVWCMSRASGEMNTSSGNGYTNLCIFLYACRALGAEEARGQFEGDDGATVVKPVECSPTSQDYAKLGWICKMENVQEFSKASFCGIVSDPEDLVNVCDIRAYIADFGWTRHQYMNARPTVLKALIRAKGYSAIYQYPSCPVIEALGRYALRVTNKDYIHTKMVKMIKENKIADSRFKSVKYLDMLEKISFKLPRRSEPPENTRKLVSDLYGVTEDQQVQIEDYLDSLEEIQELDINIDVPADWIHNWEVYATDDCIFPNDAPLQIKKFNELVSEVAPWLPQIG